MNPFSTVAVFVRDGGPFMYVILGTAVIIAAIVAERLIVVGRAATFHGRKLTNDLAGYVARGDLASARNLSGSTGSPVARVAQAVLRVGPAPAAELQAAADDAATLVLPPLARRLSNLVLLANIATLLGLLGTIFGLITAFSAVSAADPSQRSAFLAAGISQALNTTAFGLIIAVPTLLLHGWIQGMVEGIAEQVDEVSVRLVQALSQPGATHAGASVRPVAAAAGVAPAARPAAAAATAVRPATAPARGAQ